MVAIQVIHHRSVAFSFLFFLFLIDGNANWYISLGIKGLLELNQHQTSTNHHKLAWTMQSQASLRSFLQQGCTFITLEFNSWLWKTLGAWRLMGGSELEMNYGKRNCLSKIKPISNASVNNLMHSMLQESWLKIF